MSFTIGTSGDAGDLIYELGIISRLSGRPHTLLVQHDYITASGKHPEQFHRLMKRLVLAQPYISEFRIARDDDKIWWDAGGFRRTGMHRNTRTLLASHVDHLVRSTGYGAGINGHNKWLHITPSPETSGRVVINRTPRYNNPRFPWPDIVSHYGERILFSGLPTEHERFCKAFGRVEFRPCSDMLEVAELIAGSDLFIGNQSSANAIAEGLKHPLIQETSTTIPDCIWVRDNAQHCYNGICALPDVSGSGYSVTQPSSHAVARINFEQRPPPGGWLWNGRLLSYGLAQAVSFLANDPVVGRASEDKRRELLLGDARRRCPEYFADRTSTANTAIISQALSNGRTGPTKTFTESTNKAIIQPE